MKFNVGDKVLLIKYPCGGDCFNIVNQEGVIYNIVSRPEKKTKYYVKLDSGLKYYTYEHCLESLEVYI